MFYWSLYILKGRFHIHVQLYKALNIECFHTQYGTDMVTAKVWSVP